MVGLLSRLYEALFMFYSGTPARVLMLGLDAAGKTTILYKVKLNETVQQLPTIAFNVETVSPKPRIIFVVWDVGGQKNIWSLYRHYFDKTDGLLFVVDSSDRDRLHEARDELFGIITNERMASVPVVILANKSDLPTAVKIDKLIKHLSLHSISRQRAL